MNDIRKKSFSFACLIVVAMVKRFSLQIYLKQSCLEVIFLDYIFSQSININMLLQVVKKVSYANRSSHQNIFMVSDNIRITWTTHSTLKILISLVYNFSYVCLKQRWNISQTYLIYHLQWKSCRFLNSAWNFSRNNEFQTSLSPFNIKHTHLHNCPYTMQ